MTEEDAWRKADKAVQIATFYSTNGIMSTTRFTPLYLETVLNSLESRETHE